MEWLGFWICIAVFVVCEYMVFNQGCDTLLWQYTTDAEKVIQQIRIDKIKG